MVIANSLSIVFSVFPHKIDKNISAVWIKCINRKIITIPIRAHIIVFLAQRVHLSPLQAVGEVHPRPEVVGVEAGGAVQLLASVLIRLQAGIRRLPHQSSERIVVRHLLHGAVPGHHHAVVAQVVAEVEVVGGRICGDVEGDVSVLKQHPALAAVIDHVSAVVHAAQLVRWRNCPHNVLAGGPAAEVVRRAPPHGAAPLGDLDVKNCLQPLHGKLFNDGLRSLPIDSNTFIRKYTTFIWKKHHFFQNHKDSQ